MEPTSVLTGRKLADIAADEGGDIDKAASGDQLPSSPPTGKRSAQSSRPRKT
jgi:hypothetical protein